MSEPDIDRLLDQLVDVLPLLHRKLLRMDLGMSDGGLSRLHLAVMRRLHDSGASVGDLARASMIPMPQITRLVDYLVSAGIAARAEHPDDRRMVVVELTDKGKVMFHELKLKVLRNMRERLSGLSPEELEEMSTALETIRRIGTKI